MTSSYGFLPNDNLPAQDRIVAMCQEAGHLPGISLFTEPGGPIIAWVKYRPELPIEEALTQDWVAKQLNAIPEANVRAPRVYAYFMASHYCSKTHFTWTTGYIVMEYIDAPNCIFEDYEMVAQAVQTLISVRGPSSAPGHVGGGRVAHGFFVDGVSPIRYKTTEDLQSHVNGVSDHEL